MMEILGIILFAILICVVVLIWSAIIVESKMRIVRQRRQERFIRRCKFYTSIRY